MNAQHNIGSDHGRTDIQRRAGRRRHPVRIRLEQGKQAGKRLLHVDGRHSHARGRAVHSFKVVARAEELQSAVLAAVALHALKDLLRIVKHRAGGIHGKRAIGHHAGIIPAAPQLVIHDKHMVGEDLSETQLAIIRRLLFRVIRQCHRDLIHG